MKIYIATPMDPKAVEIYEFVHLYQNEWNRLEDRIVNWKLK